MTTINYRINCALISTSDKSGIVDFARGLQAVNAKLLSTGGTAELLRQHQIDVTQISDYTEFPEIMDGRVKTLHPKIYGGILARRELDQAVLTQHEIETINLVVVNLYPFQQVTSTTNCSLETAIENIDIGGVTLIRAAAKNYKHVTVVIDHADYPKILDHLQQGKLSELIRFELAKKAFMHVAKYDAAIANYFAIQNNKEFPTLYTTTYQKKQDLRYGENPQQKAACYANLSTTQTATVINAKQLQGKELSFNNVVDVDTALECVKTFSSPTCVIVKHANPCGVAIGSTLFEAYQRAYASDPISAFGGIIAFNRPLDTKTATEILKKQFVEVVIAPMLQENTQNCFAAKPNVRLLVHDIPEYVLNSESYLDYKRINGGLLVQESDLVALESSQIKCITHRNPTVTEYRDLLFAWQVAKFVKSNAIVFAKDQLTIGIGSGQTSRVYSTRIALIKATDMGLNIAGAVMASDAFFPFRDGIDTAIDAGITAIIQPGGSIRDSEVIAAANEKNIAMLFTGIRHFRH
ncbi:bifunctional AICAR transformylase/IMP cyclohydrolase [Gammaproteobacteria bacterium]